MRTGFVLILLYMVHGKTIFTVSLCSIPLHRYNIQGIICFRALSAIVPCNDASKFHHDCEKAVELKPIKSIFYVSSVEKTSSIHM